MGRLTRWQRFTRKIGKFTKRTMVASGILTAIGYAYVGGTMTQITRASDIASTTPQIASVMQRIASCESSNSQYDKSGQVLIHVNSDKSYDIGMFQINSIWETQATKLGYDLTKQKDNQEFALWLYENEGTGSWSASSKCWSK